jgi:hypothetical protein
MLSSKIWWGMHRCLPWFSYTALTIKHQKFRTTLLSDTSTSKYKIKEIWIQCLLCLNLFIKNLCVLIELIYKSWHCEAIEKNEHYLCCEFNACLPIEGLVHSFSLSFLLKTIWSTVLCVHCELYDLLLYC